MKYWKHNWLTPKAEVRRSPVGGMDVFAKEPVKMGEVVAVWGLSYPEKN